MSTTDNIPTPSNSISRRAIFSFGLVALVVIIDQVIKFFIKTRFYLGEDVEITSWFHLVFVENNGMAFGMTIGSKYFLTSFRILAVVVLGWYLALLTIRQRWGEIKTGYLVCIALITAGALGNIIDCLFYGLLFNNTMPPQVAVFLPDGGGYAPFMLGKVVDMFYFPLFSFVWPDWMPWVGGETFLFFQPVFNFADSAISVGVIALLIFYSGYMSELHSLNKSHKESDPDSSESAETPSSDK